MRWSRRNRDTASCTSGNRNLSRAHAMCRAARISYEQRAVVAEVDRRSGDLTGANGQSGSHALAPGRHDRRRAPPETYASTQRLEPSEQRAGEITWWRGAGARSPRRGRSPVAGKLANTRRFTPMPAMRASRRSPRLCVSTRMPASLRPATRTSLGHLSCAAAPALARGASQVAIPRARVSGGTPRERQRRPQHDGHVQAAARRRAPHPAVAAATDALAVRDDDGAVRRRRRASRVASSLVEPHSASWMKGVPSVTT